LPESLSTILIALKFLKDSIRSGFSQILYSWRVLPFSVRAFTNYVGARSTRRILVIIVDVLTTGPLLAGTASDVAAYVFENRHEFKITQADACRKDRRV
jgi:hypothetical protein